MFYRNALLSLLIVVSSQNCFAQAKPLSYDFLPRTKVMFEDNFINDTIGDFPAKWRMAQCIGYGKNDSAGMKLCTVQEDSLENVLSIAPYAAPHIEQKINANYNVNNIFTLEYDFELNPQESNTAVEFQIAEQLAKCRSVFFSVAQSGAIHYATFFPKIREINVHYPGYFDVYTYHHMAISFFKGNISCYVDQHKVISLPACGFNPIRFGLSFKGPAKIKNFRLATGIELNPFFKILTTKKIVSHDFLFYDFKATLKAISMRHIMELALLLKANPSVALEIDVHSDNAGEEAIIKRISQARADEIRRQLIMAGIDGARLTARGFGDTKPIKPNTTPEGMAANRRVEFIEK